MVKKGSLGWRFGLTWINQLTTNQPLVDQSWEKIHLEMEQTHPPPGINRNYTSSSTTLIKNICQTLFYQGTFTKWHQNLPNKNIKEACA